MASTVPPRPGAASGGVVRGTRGDPAPSDPAVVISAGVHGYTLGAVGRFVLAGLLGYADRRRRT